MEELLHRLKYEVGAQWRLLKRLIEQGHIQPAMDVINDIDASFTSVLSGIDEEVAKLKAAAAALTEASKVAIHPPEAIS